MDHPSILHDVLYNIVVFLNWKDLKNVRCVSREWNATSLSLLTKKGVFVCPPAETLALLLPGLEPKLLTALSVRQDRLCLSTLATQCFLIRRLKVGNVLECDVMAKAINDGLFLNLMELSVSCYDASNRLPEPEGGPKLLLQTASLLRLQSLSVFTTYETCDRFFPHILRFNQSLIDAAPNVTYLDIIDFYDLCQIKKLKHLVFRHYPSQTRAYATSCVDHGPNTFEMLSTVSERLERLSLRFVFHTGCLPTFPRVLALEYLPRLECFNCKDSYASEMVKAFPHVTRIKQLYDPSQSSVIPLFLMPCLNLKIIEIFDFEWWSYSKQFTKLCSLLLTNAMNLQTLRVNLRHRGFAEVYLETWDALLNLKVPKLVIAVWRNPGTKTSRLMHLQKVKISAPDTDNCCQRSLEIRGGIAEETMDDECLDFINSIEYTLNELGRGWKRVWITNIQMKREMFLHFQEAITTRKIPIEIFYNHGFNLEKAVQYSFFWIRS